MPKPTALDLEMDQEIIKLVQAVAGNDVIAHDIYLIIPRPALQKAALDLHNRLMPIEGADLEYAHVEQGLWDWFVNFVDATVVAAATRSVKNGESPALMSHIAAAQLLDDIRHDH